MTITKEYIKCVLSQTFIADSVDSIMRLNLSKRSRKSSENQGFT